MIAYNHIIHFISNTQDIKNITRSSKDIIVIKEALSFHKEKDLFFRKKYLNIQGRTTALSSDKKFDRTQKGQFWSFEIEDVMCFSWSSGTNTIFYIPGEQYTEKLLKYWTLHMVLPLFFSIEEKYDFLHAGAVEVEGKPILFVAESFGGKSTMTDFFIKQGHPMISDDKVACLEQDHQFLAVPSYAYHRPYRQLEDLGYFVENMVQKPKPIHAIYELKRMNADSDISISELHGIEKFKALRYSMEFSLSFLKTKQFSFLSRIAKIVPVFRVAVPWDIGRLNEVHEVITGHSKSII